MELSNEHQNRQKTPHKEKINEYPYIRSYKLAQLPYTSTNAQYKLNNIFYSASQNEERNHADCVRDNNKVRNRFLGNTNYARNNYKTMKNIFW